ncbi:ATP-binding cassette sub-family G member 2-like, partial [Planoprotostelium fungivorum]
TLLSIGNGDLMNDSWMSDISSVHGDFNPADGTCKCLPGWSGIDCSLCNTDSVCTDGRTCSHEFTIVDDMSYSCAVNFDNQALTANFHNLSTGVGTGHLQNLKQRNGGPMIFNCSLAACRVDHDSNTQTIACSNVHCYCSTWCDGEAYKDNINQITSFTIVCDTSKHLCTYDGALRITFQCNNSVCLLPTATREGANTAWTYEVRLTLLVCLAVFGTLWILLFITIIWIAAPAYKFDIPALDDYHMQASLAWEYISCTVNNSITGTEKVILNNISGFAKSGEVVAIMGPSGGGKTSFIDILAGRKNTGVIHGQVLVNGAPRDGTFKRVSGYVMQDEKLIGTLTVKEHLMYVARLKLPSNFNWSQREAKVLRTLSDLGISHIADTLIGTEMTRGISGGEKRRVTIASELVSDPCILFLDEPTSGLDSHTSQRLMKRLKTMAVERNKTILMSIHQPSSGIFNSFDQLMLLSRGECVYYGPRSQAMDHFASLGYHSPLHYNPADYLLDLVIENDRSTIRAMARSYRDGHAARDMVRQIDEAKETYLARSGLTLSPAIFRRAKYVPPPSELRAQYMTSWFTQVYVIAHRTFLNNFRNPYLLRFQYIAVSVLGIVLGGVYWHPGVYISDVKDRLGCLFFVMSLLSFSSMSSLDVFYNERSIFVRERANGMYTTSAYFVARAICDIIPMRVLPTIILGSTTYFMIGMDTSLWSTFLSFIGVLVATSLCASSLCFAVSTISPSLAFANLLTILMLLYCMLFGGFLVDTRSDGPLKILGYISFLNFGFDLLVTQQFTPLTIRVQIAPGSSEYFDITGQEILRRLNLEGGNSTVDIVGLCVWFAAYFVIAYICLKWLVKEKR